MSALTDGQKQLLFDYSLGLTDESESRQAQELIRSHAEAAQIYANLQSALAPLDSYVPEPCPDALAERTVRRLTEVANSGHEGLEQLLADEQDRPVTVKAGFWYNLHEVAAIAAAIVVIALVFLPLFSFERQRYWKRQCQGQLGDVFKGLISYISDHDGKAPTVGVGAGQPWNTRHLYLPVKLGYLRQRLFVCPARKPRSTVSPDISSVRDYEDFPSRDYVNYSPRMRCPQSMKIGGLCEGPILSDRNPIFEDWPFPTPKKVIDAPLLRINSRNHRGKGQNVLYHDGSVRFITIRRIGATGDDMFTLVDMDCGSAIDDSQLLPACQSDVFMAP